MADSSSAKSLEVWKYTRGKKQSVTGSSSSSSSSSSEPSRYVKDKKEKKEG